MDNIKQEEMTKTTKMKIIEIVGMTIGSAVLALTMMAWTINRENKKNVADMISKKADITYVDQKCQDLKSDAAIDKAEILSRLDALQSQNNQIYQILIESKK